MQKKCQLNKYLKCLFLNPKSRARLTLCAIQCTSAAARSRQARAKVLGQGQHPQTIWGKNGSEPVSRLRGTRTGMRPVHGDDPGWDLPVSGPGAAPPDQAKGGTQTNQTQDHG